MHAPTTKPTFQPHPLFNNTPTPQPPSIPDTPSPSPTKGPPQADCPLPPHHFNALLWDLLDPTRSAIDIANDYDLTPDQLAAVLESDRYTAALATIARINHARQQLLNLEAPTLAKARLLQQLRQPPQSATAHESQRKAANTLLTSCPSPRRSKIRLRRTREVDPPKAETEGASLLPRPPLAERGRSLAQRGGGDLSCPSPRRSKIRLWRTREVSSAARRRGPLVPPRSATGGSRGGAERSEAEGQNTNHPHTPITHAPKNPLRPRLRSAKGGPPPRGARGGTELPHSPHKNKKPPLPRGPSNQSLFPK